MQNTKKQTFQTLFKAVLELVQVFSLRAHYGSDSRFRALHRTKIVNTRHFTSDKNSTHFRECCSELPVSYDFLMCIYLYSSFLNLKVTCKQYLELFFISSNLFITLKTIKRILYSFNNLHNPNYSMFKTKTHNAYIIMMINKESYIKKES